VVAERVQASAPIGWIRENVLNRPDPASLARFWVELLSGEPVLWYEGWVTLDPPLHGQRLSFQWADESADLPTGAAHFDILVADLEAAHVRVLAAGGSLVEERWSPRPGPDGEPVRWRVYRDPDQHPFCLVVR
jgi:hypothetical protein